MTTIDSRGVATAGAPRHCQAANPAAAAKASATATAADALRQAFLACERQASSAVLGFADAAQCSTVYEQLLQREFRGDFRKFLAWWQSQRRTQASVPAPAPESPL